MRLIAFALLSAAIATYAQADSFKSQLETFDKLTTAAMKKKDLPALKAVIKARVTSNFVYSEAGRNETFDQMFAGMSMGLSRMTKISVAKVEVLSAKENGAMATSTNKHTIGGMVQGPDKKMHLMMITGTSTDTYVKSGSKWKMSKMTWLDGTMTMDGKPLNPAAMDQR